MLLFTHIHGNTLRGTLSMSSNISKLQQKGMENNNENT